MRLRCEFDTRVIPVSYQFMFVSLIKEALKITDENYYKKLYLYKDAQKNKKSKNFCFSVYIKGFLKEQDIFKVMDKVVLNLSTPDYKFALNLYNGLLNLKEFTYKKQYHLVKKKISLVKEKNVHSNEVVFNTLSPICIKDKDNKYMCIEDPKFLVEFKYITNRILENFRGFGLREELKFIPINMKKTVVQEKIKYFQENTGRNIYYINSYKGTFKLIGNKEDIKDIYSLGVGFKRSQGFGMIEVCTCGGD